ncbi:MAG: SRPBCC family protein [Candidatus Marinimicrobia bacterium]|nr:SRPBCC family protein [Candidatus Neomarinimicrobiota bacterium]
MVKIYKKSVTQFIDKPLDVVFSFFAKPENLRRITPSTLDFQILTPTPISMVKGTVIDYNIKVMGIRVHWRTLIKSYNPPTQFVDEQTKGPYLLWIHTHTFKIKDEGVEIHDCIEYSIPLGLLGRFVHFLWIKRKLDQIFDFRRKKIEEIFISDELSVSYSL